MCLLNNLHSLPSVKRNRPHGNPFRSVPLTAALAFCVSLPAFAGQAAQPQITPPHSVHHRHALVKEAPPAEAPAAAPAPETPKWPANEAPGRPEITWDSHGLRITAANSSLHQILDQVSTATGAKVEGMGPDERVFGSYGPGDARDVLSQLLHGSSYNVLMIGDQGKGTPREIVLSARNSGGAVKHPASNADEPSPSDAQDDENPEPPEQDDQSPPQQLMQPPVPGPPGSPGAPRTPQELLQELQQRQQEMQNQQNQQMPDQSVPSPPQN